MADEKIAEAEDEITPLFPSWHRRFGHWDAHHRLFISLGVAAVVCFAVTRLSWHWPTCAVVTWIAYSSSALLMTWYVILSADPSEAAREASIQDSTPTLIIIFVIFAEIFSVYAVGAEMGTSPVTSCFLCWRSSRPGRWSTRFSPCATPMSTTTRPRATKPTGA